jgi:hypothetical protein
MIYFLVLAALVALTGLFAIATAVQTPLYAFGIALVLFGVGFGFFLVKSHFDQADATKH